MTSSFFCSFLISILILLFKDSTDFFLAKSLDLFPFLKPLQIRNIICQLWLGHLLNGMWAQVADRFAYLLFVTLPRSFVEKVCLSPCFLFRTEFPFASSKVYINSKLLTSACLLNRRKNCSSIVWFTRVAGFWNKIRGVSFVSCFGLGFPFLLELYNF